MEIREQSALVTGGASGLGAATVRTLHAAGAFVVIADLDSGRGHALAEELGERARFVPTDVVAEADVRAAVDVAASLGPLRIAVGCAGIGAVARVLDKGGAPHDLALFRRVIDVNLVGMFNLVRLCAQAISLQAPLTDGLRGVIVNTASIAAFDGQVGQAAYSASKAAIAGMTLPLARELARQGIRVCTLCPGTMDTPLLAGLPEAARVGLAASIPFPSRLGLPSEFAALVRHVIENDYLNGETIRIDGALRMGPR